MNPLSSEQRLLIAIIPSLIPVAGLVLGVLWRQREAWFLRHQLAIDKQRLSLTRTSLYAVKPKWSK